MKNLDQIRARNALNSTITKTSEEDSDSVAKKVPAMIMNNGLIAAASFAVDKEDQKNAYASVFQAIINHLYDPEVNLLSKPQPDCRGFVEILCNMDSDHLRAVTSETMAFLNFLRRFV